MKFLKNKKSQLQMVGWAIAAIFVLLAVFAGSGVLKFLFTDKTGLIIFGIVIFFFLFLAKRGR